MLHRVLAIVWREGAGATSSHALLGQVMGSCGLLLVQPTSFASLLTLCCEVHLTVTMRLLSVIYHLGWVHHGCLASLVGSLSELGAYCLLHGP